MNQTSNNQLNRTFFIGIMLLLFYPIFWGEGYVFAQFIGGDADGFSYNGLTQTACVLNNNSFPGGIADGFSGISLCSGCSNPSCGAALPITWLIFTAWLTKDKMVLLEWTTATEINNDYFTVEKIDATNFENNNWQTIDTIKGAGNSNTPLEYSTMDKSPYQGTSYYRLKQVDFNGDSSYSDIRAVNLEGIDIINLSPNPAEREITVLLYSTEKTKVNINIYNILGQKVQTRHGLSQQINKGTNEITIDVSTFSTGYYLLEVETETGMYRVQRKLIKNDFFNK